DTVVLLEDLPNLGDRAVAVVGHSLDEIERARRAGALVENLFVSGSFDLPGTSLDGAGDRVVGHRLPFGVGDRLTKAGVTARVASAHACGDRQLLDELGEELAALGVEGPFFVLDCGPLRMAAHARKTSIGKTEQIR